MSVPYLAIEFLILFFALPLGFRYKPFPFPPIPALWILTCFCLYRLLSDPTFDRNLLWNPKALGRFCPQILITFVCVGVLVAAAVFYFQPQWLFNYVRKTPMFWFLVLLFYPVLSVYPQSVVYRAFLFQRYRKLFPHHLMMVVASAIAFAFVHIIFRNPIAISFTLIGGILFAWRYYESKSLFTSSFEHALYGCWMFTVGLGEFFYRGIR